MTAEHAAIISAVSAAFNTIAVLVSLGLVIWTSFFRKTRRDRIDELKVEIQILLSQGWAEDIINNNHSVDEFFQSLKPKFQKDKYRVLHQSAYDELGYEGRNPVINHWQDLKNTIKEGKFAQWRSRR